MKKISILHIDYDDLQNPFGSGGQALATKNLYMQKRNFKKITIITGNYPGAKNIQQNAIEYKRLGIGWLGSTISLLSFWALIPFIVLHMQQDYDVIVEFFTAPFSASLSFLVAKKPHIAVPTFLAAKELSRKYHIPFFLIENIGIQKLRYFLVQSEDVKRKILTINPFAQTYLLPFGYDDTLQHTSQSISTKLYVLFLGRIDVYNKGLDILLHAWTSLIKTYPYLKLYIAGRGKNQDEKQLLTLITKLNLHKHVVLLGNVTGKRKKKLLAQALFCIVPSRYETFCMSALETLAIGKPLIRSDIPGLSWIPTSCVLTFESTNIHALVRACTMLLTDAEKRQNLSGAGKTFAREYAWSEIARKYNTLVRDFVHNPQSLQKNFL